MNLGSEKTKICADQTYGDEAVVEFTNFTPDIATKMDGFTILSGSKQVAWEVCDIFDVFTDGIELVPIKSSEKALNILAGEKQGQMVAPEKKDHRILESVTCYEIY